MPVVQSPISIQERMPSRPQAQPSDAPSFCFSSWKEWKDYARSVPQGETELTVAIPAASCPSNKRKNAPTNAARTFWDLLIAFCKHAPLLSMDVTRVLKSEVSEPRGGLIAQAHVVSTRNSRLLPTT